MKQKKRGRCKCLTLNMWRCWEFCTCANECGEVEEVESNNNETPTPAPAPAPIVEPEPAPEPEPTDDGDNDNDNYVEPEIPDEVLENPTEESLDDLNS